MDELAEGMDVSYNRQVPATTPRLMPAARRALLEVQLVEPDEIGFHTARARGSDAHRGSAASQSRFGPMMANKA